MPNTQFAQRCEVLNKEMEILLQFPKGIKDETFDFLHYDKGAGIPSKPHLLILEIRSFMNTD